MAEFLEVCKQAIRRHVIEDNALGAKTTAVWIGISATGDKVDCGKGYIAYPPEALEKEIMDWAAKNPEPRYPTWEEWQKKNFPTAHDAMHPCAFMKREEIEKVRGVECGRISCNHCARSPIPADIAEKLGIKPIGGNET